METNLFELLKIPSLSSTRKYWTVRSNSGIFYEDFVLHDYIAIAWDYVTINILFTQQEDVIRRLIASSEKINPSTEDDEDDEDSEGGESKSKVTTILNKLYRFTKEINIGDVVLVPSKASEHISIGIIESNVYEDSQYAQQYLLENQDTEITPCPYYKRRKVKWIKTLSKSTMDIYFLKAFSSQHALSCMDEYAPFIDRAIYPIYQKGSETHTTIHAGHPNGLTLKELAEFTNCLISSIDDISEQCSIEIPDEDIHVKLNIHSPGLIELIGYGLGAGVAISLILFTINHLINGGTFKIALKKDTLNNLDFSIESESKGIREQDRSDKELNLKEKESLISLIKDLDIKSPEVIAAVLNGDKVSADMLQVQSLKDTDNKK